MRRPGSQHGFTLIELLITILIIGILAAIGMASYNGQRGKAYNAQAKSVIRDVGAHAWAYGLEHDWDFSNYQTQLLADEPRLSVAGVADGSNPETPGPTRNPNQLWLDVGEPSAAGICNLSKGDRGYCVYVQDPNLGHAWDGAWATSLRNGSVGDTYWQDQADWQRWHQQRPN